MECILSGISKSTEEMVRYITMCEHSSQIKHVQETLYKVEQTILLLSTEKTLYGAHKGQKSYLKVILPSDRSKSRKSLTRGTLKTEILQDNGVQYILEDLGGTLLRTREYVQKIYAYKGAQIIIAQKEDKEIVLLKCTKDQETEGRLEEIKKKLSIWIDLVVPPEDIWDLLF
ncbi:hypothetical protein NEFER03_0232 [Nematocida sp. LUAm3]|nr:hypothetical protein NEFER03_0232 [Nematocida sp. LUAm3]KAI5173685.1 hypothetical protein NEFER02_0201 [Nematocida sp. LUAm2]KAI5176906.1 hypothetical protein NEFER01_0231 [Nematocida sp. LUAm1]